MAVEVLEPKVDQLAHQTSNLEDDMRDVRERITRVEEKVDNQGDMIKDIHKWITWFVKTILGAFLAGAVGGLLTFLGNSFIW